MFSEKTKEKDNEKTLGQQFKEKMEEYFAFALKYAPQKDGKLKNEEWDMQNVEGEDKQKLNTIQNELKELHMMGVLMRNLISRVITSLML